MNNLALFLFDCKEYVPPWHDILWIGPKAFGIRRMELLGRREGFKSTLAIFFERFCMQPYWIFWRHHVPYCRSTKLPTRFPGTERLTSRRCMRSKIESTKISQYSLAHSLRPRA